jgi:hypothetical protein
MSSAKEKKIRILQENLTIFREALTNTRIRMENEFQNAKNDLLTEYNYRNNLQKQLDMYKFVLYDNDKEKIEQEKNKLQKIYETYNKIKNPLSLERANNAILDESDAHTFLLNSMSALLDEIIDLVGDQGESITKEIDELLN